MAGRLPLVVAAAAALTGLLVVTAVPVPTGDLFVALAGGRDVLAGRLGEPDDWSFATAGRVWVNQNWGSGLLFYAAHAVAGEGGLVALKLVLTLAVLAAMTALARSTGAGWAAALLAAALGLWTARWFPELRPNLLTMLFAPLLVWLLRVSPRRPVALAAAVALVTVWANAHGGFMLGLLLLGLWALARAVAATRSLGAAAAARVAWPALAAAAAGTLLSAVASPFGWTNLTFSLRLADPAWRTVREWAPMTLARHELFGSPWEFVTVAVVALVASAVRLPAGIRAGRGSDGAPTAVAAFDLVVVVTATTMAVSAWRFVGVALVVLAPLAAPVVERVLQPSRRTWPTAAAVLLLAVAATPVAGRLARHYDVDSPRFAGEGTFERLFQLDTFPTGAVRFLAANGVTGRAFNDWRWEGYLRWAVPALRVFVGGRAQQVYDWATVERYMAVPASAQPAAELAAIGADLVVVPMHLAWDPMVERLALQAGARWLIVYYDGRDAVLVDAGSPAQRALVDGVRTGRLQYPNPAVAGVSCALALACPPGGAAAAERFDALASAAREMPTIGVYWALAALERRGELCIDRLLTFLEQEQSRLAALDHRRAGGVGALKAKWAVAWQLSEHYRAAGRSADAARLATIAANLRAELWSVLSW
jgi:hypothetical protein